jgi:predicted DCC family thiol-disulfide oxidoreductase YuxK
MHVESGVVSSLPSTAERPEADVIIFDGQCSFCRAQVERLAAWDRKGRLAFVSLHDPEVARRWPDLSHEQLMDEMYVVDQQGRRHGGALALRYLARRLPRLWVVLPLLLIPGSLPLWRSLYRWVARRRYQLRGVPPCDDGTCRIHSRS